MAANESSTPSIREASVGKYPTAQQLAQCQWDCEVCGGKGHEYWECPTKRRLDKFAKNNGDSVAWGAWKYYKYYKNFTAEQRKLHGELALKESRGKRTFKQY